MNIHGYFRSRLKSGVLTIVLIGLMSACASESTLKLSPDEAKANLDKLFENDLQICINGEMYMLNPSAGHYEIPANKFVILYARKFMVRTKKEIRYCNPGAGIVAKESARYLADLSHDEGVCKFDLYELDANGHNVGKIDVMEVQHSCFYYGRDYSGWVK